MSLEVSFAIAERDVDVSFRVATGTTVALLGPNGAGKSTTLAVLAGLLRPDRARVILDDEPLTDDERWVPPHARRTALLAQEPLLFPHLDVLANVAFGPRSRGAGRASSTATARHWLGEVDAADLADRRPAALSGGQAQRVAVARALAAEPRLLLLDEPMASLDVAVAPALRQLLRRVLAERTTVLVTHHVLDALLLADEVVVLEAGRVVEQGPTADVLARPRSAFAARFAGLNLLAGSVEAIVDDGLALRTETGGVVHGIAGGRAASARVGSAAVAVFRPSAVAVHRDPPGGSPRNALPVTIEELEPVGDLVRVRGGGLAADVTAAAVADVGLTPGTEVIFVVKASEVVVHPR
ncbi:sulfate/molybdate ABC transporter ATP-binding protein [Nocardioides sp.]|uniref:sulfate/molybdate ABC transporter ATP-binding protein n=1 Tax=Nocardioides sp. TaxID=35761 RepID=UPI0035126652